MAVKLLQCCSGGSKNGKYYQRRAAKHDVGVPLGVPIQYNAVVTLLAYDDRKQQHTTF